MKFPLLLRIAAACFIFFTTTTASNIITDSSNNNNGSSSLLINNSSLSPDEDIDKTRLSFKFAVTWPYGYCKFNPCSQRPAELKPKFTIHGLWPDYDGTCTDSTKPFNLNDLASHASTLNEYWPNLRDHNHPEIFWEYEWNHHGKKCKLFETMKSYFIDAALRLYNERYKKNLDVLANPDNPQRTSIAYIQSLFGKKPFVMCQEVDGINYLYELRFCIGGDKKKIDCEPQTSQARYCSEPFRYG